MSTTPTVTSIIPTSVALEVVYLLLYTDEGREQFEQHTTPVLGMAMLDRDPTDGQLDYIVHEAEYQSPVTLSEFSSEGANRHVVGVRPVGSGEIDDCDLAEAQVVLRLQVKAHREQIARRIAEHEAQKAGAA